MSPDNDTKCLLNHQIQSGNWCFILNKCGSANLSIEIQLFSILKNYLHWSSRNMCYETCMIPTQWKFLYHKSSVQVLQPPAGPTWRMSSEYGPSALKHTDNILAYCTQNWPVRFCQYWRFWNASVLCMSASIVQLNSEPHL